jgi:hypothetical protein
MFANVRLVGFHPPIVYTMPKFDVSLKEKFFFDKPLDLTYNLPLKYALLCVLFEAFLLQVSCNV